MMFGAENPVYTEPINGRHAPTVPWENRTTGQYTLGVTTFVSSGALMMKPVQNRKFSHSLGRFLLQYRRSRSISTV